MRQFGETMMKDHAKAAEELMAIVDKQKKVRPAATLDSQQQAMIDKLNKVSGADFDKAYVDAMVEDHDMDVKFF